MEGKPTSVSRLPILGKNVASGKPSPAKDDTNKSPSAPSTMTAPIAKESSSASPLTLSGKTPVQLMRMESNRGRSDSWEWDGSAPMRASLSPGSNLALHMKATQPEQHSGTAEHLTSRSSAPNTPTSASRALQTNDLAASGRVTPHTSGSTGSTTPKTSARDRERVRRAALERLSVAPGELAALALHTASSSASSSSKPSPARSEKPLTEDDCPKSPAAPAPPEHAAVVASTPPLSSSSSPAVPSAAAAASPSPSGAWTPSLALRSGSGLSGPLSPVRTGSPIRSQVVVPRPHDSAAHATSSSPNSSASSAQPTPVSSGTALHKKGSSLVRRPEVPLAASAQQQTGSTMQLQPSPGSRTAASPHPGVPAVPAASSSSPVSPSSAAPSAVVSSPSLVTSGGSVVLRSMSGSVLPADPDERARLWQRELELKEKELEAKERRLQEKERQIDRKIDYVRRSPRPHAGTTPATPEPQSLPDAANGTPELQNSRKEAKPPATKSPRVAGSMVVIKTESHRYNAALVSKQSGSVVASPNATSPAVADDSNDFNESRVSMKKAKKEKKEKGSNLKKISLSLRKLGDLGYPAAPVSPSKKSPKAHAPEKEEQLVSPKNLLSTSGGSRSARNAPLQVPKVKDSGIGKSISGPQVNKESASAILARDGNNVKVPATNSGPLPPAAVSPLSSSITLHGSTSTGKRMPEKSRSTTSMRGQMISPVAAPSPQSQTLQQPPFDKERLLMATGRDDSRDDISKLGRDGSESSMTPHGAAHARFGTMSAATGASLSVAASSAVAGEPVLIESATVDQLIAALADENLPDWKFVREFLVVYRYFLPPDDLLSRLINRFMYPKGEEGPIRLRVINILKRWLNQHFYDFEDQKTLNTFIAFIDSKVDPWNNKWANALRFALQEKNSKSMLGQLGANCSLEVISMALKKSGIVRDHILKKSDFPKSFIASEAVVWLTENLKLSSPKEAVALGNNLMKEKFITNCVSEGTPFSDDDQSYFRFLRQPTDPIELPTPKPLFKKKYLDRDPHTLTFAEFQPQEIARQLTLVEHKYYRRIQPTEIKSQGWNKANRHQLSPNVCALTERFNKMSYWVATEIVLAPANEAHKVIERMIQIAVHLCELRNFNTLIATVAGLNLSAVARLKDAWSRVGKANLASFQELTELCNPISNYRQYREAFKHVQPPAVPYIALYLHDLTFIEDGNADYVDGEGKTVINFAKMRMIANVFLAIEKFQRVDFNLQQVQTILDVLGSSRCVTDEDDLYKLSTLQSPSSRESSQSLSSKEVAALRAQILKAHSANTLHSSISVPSLADLAKGDA